MKAFVRVDAGSQTVSLAEVPVPQYGADEVLIKVGAFGVGIHDRYFIPASPEFPYVIGTEGAGTITALGANVTDHAVGDRVIFTTIMQAQGGCWAEYAVAKQNVLIALPDELSFAQGAAVPIAGRTALECMRALDLKAGDRLFIAGASGAIGTLVIQLAVAKGIHVSATASQKNHEHMLSLGADKAVDYNDPQWKEQIKGWSSGGVAAALAIQPGTGADSIEVVRNGGKLITVSGDNATVNPVRDITVEQMGHHDDTTELVVYLVSMIAKGSIKIVIEQEFPFDKAVEALDKTGTRHARGKLVVVLPE